MERGRRKGSGAGVVPRRRRGGGVVAAGAVVGGATEASGAKAVPGGRQGMGGVTGRGATAGAGADGATEAGGGGAVGARRSVVESDGWVVDGYWCARERERVTMGALGVLRSVGGTTVGAAVRRARAREGWRGYTIVGVGEVEFHRL